MSEARKRVVIVGAGFGGLAAARALGRAPADVLVIDRRNHHLFQPLLYQVATAALNPSDIAAPIRKVLRRRVLLAYEAAEREENPAARREWLTFAIVGGGPTGVELAGALAEIARHALARDFRRINPTDARVVLIEGQGRVLAGSAIPP